MKVTTKYRCSADPIQNRRFTTIEITLGEATALLKMATQWRENFRWPNDIDDDIAVEYEFLEKVTQELHDTMSELKYYRLA